MGSWPAAALLLCACLGADTPSAPLAPTPLAFELGGCVSRLRDGTCEVTPGRTLHVWAEAPPEARFEARAAGRSIPLTCRREQGGHTCAVPAPSGPTSLELRAIHPTGALYTDRIPITPSSKPPAVEQADALRKNGELTAAATALQPWVASDDPTARAHALGLLARIRLAEGDTVEGERLFREAIRLHRAAGRLTQEGLDTFALSYALVFGEGRYSEARSALEELAARSPEDPEVRAMAPHYAAVIAYQTGDLRAAWRSLVDSDTRSARLDLDAHRAGVLQLQALVLLALGRGADARALLHRTLDRLGPDLPACARADLFNNLGLLPAAGTASPALRAKARQEAIHHLERALREAETCASPRIFANILTDLAFIELEDARLPAARAHLAEARARLAQPHPHLRALWLDLDGLLALRAADPRAALEAYRDLEDLASPSLLPDASWRAALGRARAFEALARPDLARAAHAEADRRMDRLLLLSPLGEGRDTMLGRFERAAADRVRFLAREHPEEALEVARRSRARALSALLSVDRIDSLSPPERARWEQALSTYRRLRADLEQKLRAAADMPADSRSRALSLAEPEAARLAASLEDALATLGSAGLPAREPPLRPAAPGEALLVFHPAGEGWIGFASLDGTLVVEDLGPLDLDLAPQALSRALLTPFAPVLRRATRIRLLPYGDLDRIDLHALPFDGQPLIARAPVVYGVDVPTAQRPPRAPGPPAAVIAADPSDDLPGARREAKSIAAHLSEHGYSITQLLGEQASHAELLRRIDAPSVALLHYAGHATWTGIDGWESRLDLASGTRLTIGDLLAMPSAPESVVLSGCDTARTSESARAEGLGLAHAFVLRGSSAVLAATRSVPDGAAAALMSDVYSAALAGPTIDLAAALREAQTRAVARGPARDWEAFRVLVP
ncbi:MAG: CHAT domain-containing protein [Polyangiaceae bacterium]